MGELSDQFVLNCLYTIKKIAKEDKDGKNFLIVYRDKNTLFLENNEMTIDDVKPIVFKLEPNDMLGNAELDRDCKREGFVFKFAPTYKGIKLYLKIRLEMNTKVICISIHEFGMYD